MSSNITNALRESLAGTFLVSEAIDTLVFTLCAGAALTYLLNKVFSTNPRVARASKPYGVFDEKGVLWNARSVGKFVSVPDNGATTLFQLMTKAIEAGGEHPAAGNRPLIERTYEDFHGKQVEKREFADHYEWLTFTDYGKRMADFGAGLVAVAGMKPKERIMIYAETQLEWMLAAQAAFRQGLTVVTAYATLGEEGFFHSVMQTKAKCVITDAKLLAVLGSMFKKHGSKMTKFCDKVIYIRDAPTVPDETRAAAVQESLDALAAAGLSVTTFEDVMVAGAESPIDASPPSPEDCAVIMYTSGTTGMPKGVMLSHANVVACVSGLKANLPHYSFRGVGKETYIAYLPLAHIIELVAEITVMSAGFRCGYGSPHTLTPAGIQLKAGRCLGDAECLHPTMMVMVPAVVDKLYAGMHAKVRRAGKLAQLVFKWGLEAGDANFERGVIGAPWYYNQLAFKKVQKLLGGELKALITGSAPLSPAVQKLAQTAFNCPVRQAYGLTETTASAIAEAGQSCTGIIGPPLVSTCIKLKDWPEGNYLKSDALMPEIGMPRGEILIGGPTICMGYLVGDDNPDKSVKEKNKTEFSTDADGTRWFHTGDIGQFLADGSLQVIDRKKDLVKLQQGEYVSLAKVENALQLSPLVEQAACVARSTESYCVALVCPQRARLKELAASMDIKGEHAKLCANPQVAAKVAQELQEVCKDKLARFEIPQKVALCAEPWSAENAMLTAALKLKRVPIIAKHKVLVDALFC